MDVEELFGSEQIIQKLLNCKIAKAKSNYLYTLLYLTIDALVCNLNGYWSPEFISGPMISVPYVNPYVRA